MTKKIGCACGYLMLLPLALLSMFVYKLALQPAIHQFYMVEPNLLMGYGLVFVAAVVHAVLLASLVLKYYASSWRLASLAMSAMILLYCVQMAWLSPLVHMLFWLTVFLSYLAVWLGVLKLGLYFMLEDEQQEANAPSNESIVHAQALFDYSSSHKKQT